MKTTTFLKTTVAVATLTVAFGTVPTASQAQQTYNLCLLDSVPPSFIRTVTRRSNFPELLSRMFEVCPIAALALSEAATASIGTGPADGRDQRDREGGGFRTVSGDSSPVDGDETDDGGDETDDGHGGGHDGGGGEGSGGSGGEGSGGHGGNGNSSNTNGGSGSSSGNGGSHSSGNQGGGGGNGGHNSGGDDHDSGGGHEE